MSGNYAMKQLAQKQIDRIQQFHGDEAMKINKAIIIGGGVAGPVSALFLKRIGVEAEIFEARPQAQEVEGSFLNLAGNGLEILRLLDLDAPLSAEGSPVPRMIMKNGQGKPLGEVRNGARNGLTESVIIRRGALHKILLDAAIAEGIRVHFGARLRSYTETSTGVEATFDNGQTIRGDLLIGCDGIHSQVRQLLNPNAPQPHFTHLVSTGGFTFKPELEPTPKTQYFIFGKKAFFGYHVRASGEIYWFNNHEWPYTPKRDELRGIASDEWRQRLLDMHRDDLPLIREIIGSTQDNIAGYGLYDIPTQPIWSSDRVVLTGDAVHAVSPSSGQGASMAMEDAAMLVKCLRDCADLRSAFQTYENLRRGRVERIVKWARTMGSQKMVLSPLQVWFRDSMMPIFLKFGANPAAMDWVYNYQVNFDQPVTA
jgi:2-polyprenyl-6-methoxyphenol hydroxylase-like FAD-dependent oxidoreductase